jgi:hypothetical protein
MKNMFSALRALPASLVFIGCILALTNCDNEDPNAELEKTLSLINDKTWKVHSVDAGGIDRTDIYAGMQLEFHDAVGQEISFTSSGADPVWPDAGYMKFTDANTFTIYSSPSSSGLGGFWTSGKIDSVTESILVLRVEWQYQTVGPGRKKSTVGDHIFTLSN